MSADAILEWMTAGLMVGLGLLIIAVAVATSRDARDQR